MYGHISHTVRVYCVNKIELDETELMELRVNRGSRVCLVCFEAVRQGEMYLREALGDTIYCIACAEYEQDPDCACARCLKRVRQKGTKLFENF